MGLGIVCGVRDLGLAGLGRLNFSVDLCEMERCIIFLGVGGMG